MPSLHGRLQGLLGAEAQRLVGRSGGALAPTEAAALLSYTVGDQAVGTLPPDLTAGCAAAVARGLVTPD